MMRPGDRQGEGGDISALWPNALGTDEGNEALFLAKGTRDPCTSKHQRRRPERVQGRKVEGATSA